MEGVLSWQAIVAFFVVGLGYSLTSAALQLAFYDWGQAAAGRWKVQPEEDAGLHHAGRSWLPALWRTKPGRHPLHQAWGTLNVIVASVCGALTVEAAYRDLLPLQHWSVGGSVQSAPLLLPLRVPLTGTETGTPLVVDVPSHVVHVAFWVVVMFLYESVTEYYWHRMMHLPWCYKTCHRYHHFYKAPEPFDDMFIHPLEALGFYTLCLYTPAFLFPAHVHAFALYMAWNGVTGILDHSGIAVHIPLLYNSADHDAHHQYVDVNYGFPHIFLDILHGTFVGEWAGKRYLPAYKAPLRKEDVAGQPLFFARRAHLAAAGDGHIKTT